jgi:hypothetical protein
MTTITNSTVNRLPGEFQIPIIPYGHVVVPGARAKLNLFEPRWLTLFSKLLKPEDAEEDRTILTSHEWGGSRDAKTIDFSKVEMIADYESGERRFDIVPGANRTRKTASWARTRLARCTEASTVKLPV